MVKKGFFFLCVAMLVLCMASTALAYDTLYVDTPNGKSLNLRAEPNTGNNIIGSIPNFAAVGSELMVGMPRGWSYVHYNGYEGYVQTRYLSSTDPLDRKHPVNPDPDPAEADIKALFKGFRQVEPTTAIAAPVGSFVNLRWAPTQEAAVMEKCQYGQRLTILSENKAWAQVRDDETGMVGFMMRKFIKEINMD